MCQNNLWSVCNANQYNVSEKGLLPFDLNVHDWLSRVSMWGLLHSCTVSVSINNSLTVFVWSLAKACERTCLYVKEWILSIDGAVEWLSLSKPLGEQM